MPSLDIKSEIDSHELLNAIDQANRVISNRFDFKGTESKFTLDNNGFTKSRSIKQSVFFLKYFVLIREWFKESRVNIPEHIDETIFYLGQSYAFTWQNLGYDFITTFGFSIKIGTLIDKGANDIAILWSSYVSNSPPILSPLPAYPP